ncbi:MAG: hypothetical protein OEZ38_06210 [Gammaproteobacteria bacterium]|nr:hypothetical protein [Gammaproteobacteria bacterium]
MSPEPGVGRADRISGEGLQRLEKQLERGSKISALVLRQWIKRYGESAREMLKKHGCYTNDLE